MDWDDARFFLAILRSGSLSRAARELGCSHSTVRRRIGGLEATVGVPLFVASSEGLVATDAAREALPQAEALEHAAHAFARQLSGRSEALTGRLVITTLDVLAEWVAPSIGLFAARHPAVELELISDNRYLDLTRREADVAIRATNNPSESLFGRRVGRFDFAPFAARRLVERCGAELEALPWGLYAASAGAVLTERWYRGWSNQPPLVRVTNGRALFALVRAGVAAALLPEMMGADPDLVRLGPVVEALGVDVWCLTHYDLRQSARVRAFMDCVAETAQRTPRGPP